MKTFKEFILENIKLLKAPNGWEFSVEEITNILQDFIDEGMRLSIWEAKGAVNDNDVSPICVTIIGGKNLTGAGEEKLSKRAIRIINRLKEFGFSNILYDGETHYGTVLMPDGQESYDLYISQIIYINDCVDDKYSWKKGNM